MNAKKALIVLAVLVMSLGTVTASEEYRFVKMWPESPRGWHFWWPHGVAVDKVGNVYIADSGNHRIKKFDSKGRFILQWGSAGEGEGQFGNFSSIKVDRAGTVYVVDWLRHLAVSAPSRIQKFTPYGEFKGTCERRAPGADKFELTVDVAVDGDGTAFVLAADYMPDRKQTCPVRVEKYSADGKFIRQWGSAGHGDGQFAAPAGIAVDKQGNVYVADTRNGRVQKFDSNGKFLTKWGNLGQSDGLLKRPRSIAFDRAGNVYVLERYSVQKFTANRKFLSRWDMEREISQPHGQIATDLCGNVYVADSALHRILKFDLEGNVVSKWGSAGSGDGQLRSPGSITVDSSGNAFVADVGNTRIQKFDSQGKFLSKWGSRYRFGIADVAVDASANLYLAGFGSHEVQKFNADGKLVARWGDKGSGDGQFQNPQGIALGPSGNVYVADADNSRVQKFTSDGKFLGKWGSEGTANGQFIYPDFIAVDGSGNVWVQDHPGPAKIRIQKFDRNGKFLTKSIAPSLVWAVDLSGNAYRSSFQVPGATIQKYDRNGKLVATFDRGGGDEEKLGWVSAMCVDASGYIYVTEWDEVWVKKRSLRKFDSKGKLLSRWTADTIEGMDRIPYSYRIAVDGAGNVYLPEWHGVSIRKLTPDGKLAAKFRMEPPAREGRFTSLGGVALDASAKVYVVDSSHIDWGSPSIQKFDPNGEFVMEWGGPGTANGEFKSLASIAVDASGNAYVTDQGSHCVHKFDPQGRFIKSWGSKGKEDGQFNVPEGIAVDKPGNVYVCDRQNSRIQKFDSDGKFLRKWGKEGSGPREFHFPAAVALDKKGNAYVADTDNHRVQKFTPAGKFLTEWGEFGDGPGQLNVPLGIAVDAAGNVFVSDSHNHRIQKFAPVPAGGSEK